MHRYHPLKQLQSSRASRIFAWKAWILELISLFIKNICPFQVVMAVPPPEIVINSQPTVHYLDPMFNDCVEPESSVLQWIVLGVIGLSLWPKSIEEASHTVENLGPKQCSDSIDSEGYLNSLFILSPAGNDASLFITRELVSKACCYQGMEMIPSSFISWVWLCAVSVIFVFQLR